VQSKKEIKREAKLSQILTGTRESDISVKTISVTGSEVPKVEDMSSDTESDNSTHGYFDPPIQNYRSMQ
jgi:predicted nucleotidyltransferase